MIFERYLETNQHLAAVIKMAKNSDDNLSPEDQKLYDRYCERKRRRHQENVNASQDRLESSAHPEETTFTYDSNAETLCLAFFYGEDFLTPWVKENYPSYNDFMVIADKICLAYKCATVMEAIVGKNATADSFISVCIGESAQQFKYLEFLRFLRQGSQSHGYYYLPNITHSNETTMSLDFITRDPNGLLAEYDVIWQFKNRLSSLTVEAVAQLMVEKAILEQFPDSISIHSALRKCLPGRPIL
jgi:hypothetical protein